MTDKKPEIIFEQSYDLSNRKHILIVDDDPEVLKTLRYYLHSRRQMMTETPL